MTATTPETALSTWQSLSGHWTDSRFPDDTMLHRGLISGEEGAEVLAAAIAYVTAIGRVQRCVLKGEQGIRGGAAHWAAELRKEVVDAQFTLLSLAHRAGFSLPDAMEEQWAALDAKQYEVGQP